MMYSKPNPKTTSTVFMPPILNSHVFVIKEGSVMHFFSRENIVLFTRHFVYSSARNSVSNVLAHRHDMLRSIIGQRECFPVFNIKYISSRAQKAQLYSILFIRRHKTAYQTYTNITMMWPKIYHRTTLMVFLPPI